VNCGNAFVNEEVLLSWAILCLGPTFCSSGENLMDIRKDKEGEKGSVLAESTF